MKKRATWILAAILASIWVTAGQAQETFTATWSGLPLFIPDKDANTTVSAVVFVPQAFEVLDIDVEILIAHPKIKDLTVDLVSPEGTVRRIADRVCDTHADFGFMVFDDEANVPIGTVCPPGPDRFRPSESLDRFDGQNSFGTWVLRIRDREQNKFVGFLLRYTITFTGMRHMGPTFNDEGIVNDASLRRGPMSPGEIVSLFGTELGPVEPVSAQPDPETGAWPAELAGVRVNIGGTDVPLFFVSLYKLTFQVSWEVPRGEFLPVQTFFEGEASSVVQIGTHNTTPGAFSLFANGRGQAKAINQDGTLNGPDNPAARGSVIIVYAAGLGEVEPPVETGVPAPLDHLSTVVFPATATIGNEEADVLYAGLAPGLTSIYQLNIQVPESILPRERSPLVIENDHKPSQPLMWIPVQ